MKELSIEEKAKAYDKALVIARSRYSVEIEESVRICLELMFPELKESEDERIRKEIISIVKSYRENCITEGNHKFDDCLGWLEKQGEKILANSVKTCKDGYSPKFRVGDTIKCKYDDRQFTIKSVDFNKGTYTYTQEGYGNDIDYADEEFELVEQKPADEIGNYDHKKVLQTILNEQKPVEWSEEDENAIGVIQNIIRHSNKIDANIYTNEIKEKLFSCLKSLKPQPKQEWSEEDENEVAVLEAYIRSNDWSESHVNRALGIVNELVKKLKSLKPRNHWKPNEEQMKQLGWIAEQNKDNMIGKKLMSLYQDLKRLREE